MKVWREVLLASATLVAVCAPGNAANIGQGFGETLWVLVTARQAGTGGLALEDPWRQDRIIEVSSIVLESGLRWFEVGYQGGITRALRVGGELFTFSAPGIEQTTELSDGSYSGSSGAFDMREYGGRAVGQFTVLNSKGWRVAAIGRVSGILQDFPDIVYGGVGADVGAQGQLRPTSNTAVLLWGWLGPIGRGAGRGFTSQATMGASYVYIRPQGMAGRSVGCAVGLELRALRERLFHSSLGTVVWMGNPTDRGVTWFGRVGVKEAQASAQVWQPHVGLGVLWKNRAGFGIQFDYAVAASGDLGNYHYVTMSIRQGRHIGK